jgi:hypothetical protein
MGCSFSGEIDKDSCHILGCIPTNILPFLNGMSFRRPSVNPRKKWLNRYPQIWLKVSIFYENCNVKIYPLDHVLCVYVRERDVMKIIYKQEENKIF